MFITKSRAAHRQLDAAIELHFDAVDVVAVSSLAALAARLLGEIIAVECPDRTWSRHAAEIDHLDTTGYVELERRSRQILEQRRPDASGWLEFSTRETEDLMFLAVMNAAEIGGLSVRESTFRLWYCATRATALGGDFPLVVSATRMFPHMYALDRRQRLELGREQLDRLLGRREPRHADGAAPGRDRPAL